MLFFNATKTGAAESSVRQGATVRMAFVLLCGPSTIQLWRLFLCCTTTNGLENIITCLSNPHPRSPAPSKMWVLSCSLPFGICECCSTGEGTYISHMWACALPLIICPDPGLPLFPSTLITINLQRVQEGAWSMTPEPLLSNFLINQVIIPHLSDFNRKTTKLFQGRGLWNLVS